MNNKTYYNYTYTYKHCHPKSEAMVTARTKLQKLRCNWCKRFVKVDNVEEVIVATVGE